LKPVRHAGLRVIGVCVLLFGLLLLVAAAWQMWAEIAMFGESGWAITAWDVVDDVLLMAAGVSLLTQGGLATGCSLIAGSVLTIHGLIWAVTGYPTAGVFDRAPNAVWGSAYPWIVTLLPGLILLASSWRLRRASLEDGPHVSRRGA
jgi:hypothetical protein